MSNATETLIACSQSVIQMQNRKIHSKKTGNEFIETVAGVQIQSDTKKRELLKNPTKIEEIQEKKFIDRN